MLELTEMTTKEHMVDVWKLTKAYVAELPQSDFVDSHKLQRSCYLCVQDVDRKNLNVWLVYKEGYTTAIGFAVAIASPNWYNDLITTELKVWYILPEYRGTRAFLKLLKAYEQWARLRSAHILYTGVASNLSDLQTERTSKLLEKLGYPLMGRLHAKETGQ